MIAGKERIEVPESPSRVARKKKPLELQIRENQIEHQKLVIESQRSRLKQQQREISDLKKMSNQIDQGESNSSWSQNNPNSKDKAYTTIPPTSQKYICEILSTKLGSTLLLYVSVFLY